MRNMVVLLRCGILSDFASEDQQYSTSSLAEYLKQNAFYYAKLDIFHIDNQVQNDNNTGLRYLIDVEIVFKKKH